ncbi:MAG: DUF4160 domain-containing protein [Synergistaceae bacterium]|nr:DUF4160 domain-containing protein [Synergistaceae bacterium]
MPTILRIGRYVIYFWTNENNPREPIHVHIALGRARPHATKLWISSTGQIIICNNNSLIPEKILRKIIRALENRVDEIIGAWFDYFGEVKFHC